MYFVAILTFFFALSPVQASEFTQEDIKHIKKSNFSSKLPDIELMVTDELDNKRRFALHSEVLRLSKYFYSNWELKNKNVLVVNKYIYRTASIANFKKVIAFMYGAPVKFLNHDQLYAILLLQDQLEILKLDDILIAEIKNNLNAFTPKLLTQILKFVHRNQRPFGKKSREIILSYIALNHDKHPIGNCNRYQLVGLLRGYSDLVEEIDSRIAGKIKQISHGPGTYGKAQKI